MKISLRSQLRVGAVSSTGDVLRVHGAAAAAALLLCGVCADGIAARCHTYRMLVWWSTLTAVGDGSADLL